MSVVRINLCRAKQADETERKHEIMVEKNKAVRNKCRVVRISGCPSESGVATMSGDRTFVKPLVNILKWLSVTVLLRFGDCCVGR